jgi:co-chaperonin GroES (HSP10)
MSIRLFRGVVVIREEKQRASSIIIDPEYGDMREKTKVHVGTVLAKGPPAQIVSMKHGAKDVPYDFEVGDRVYFSWQHNENEFTKLWEDGKPACWIPQWCVHAVLEETDNERGKRIRKIAEENGIGS